MLLAFDNYLNINLYLSEKPFTFQYIYTSHCTKFCIAGVHMNQNLKKLNTLVRNLETGFLSIHCRRQIFIFITSFQQRNPVSEFYRQLKLILLLQRLVYEY